MIKNCTGSQESSPAWTGACALSAANVVEKAQIQITAERKTTKSEGETELVQNAKDRQTMNAIEKLPAFF